jgi:hypothetical protein
LGITVTSYNRFERGERRAYFDQVLTIAKMLDVSIEQLTREPTPEERVDLFHRRQQTQANVSDETKRELQHELEHQAAETVQHDLADRGFVTTVTESAPGTVVTANVDASAGTNDDESTITANMLADWGLAGDDEDDE